MKRIEALADSSELIACKAISNGALASQDLPNEIKLLNWGRNETVKGVVIVDDTTAAVLAANQREFGYDRIALDFEHNTVEGTPEFKRTQEPRDVAGYGVPKIIQGDGLYLTGITYTDIGKAKAKNFADLSPTPLLDMQRRVIFLHSVALVRNGAVHDLSFFTANVPNKTESTMTPEQIQAAIATGIAAALKPVTDQLATLSADFKALKEAKPAEPLIVLTADGKETKLTLAEAGAKLIALEAGVNATKLAAETAEKSNVIALFAKEGKAPKGEDGKVLTPEALGALPLGELKRLHANTPVTVALSARAGKPPEGQKSTDGLTGIDRAIAAHKAERGN